MLNVLLSLMNESNLLFKIFGCRISKESLLQINYSNSYIKVKNIYTMHRSYICGFDKICQLYNLL